jgi:hypothetical protein
MLLSLISFFFSFFVAKFKQEIWKIESYSCENIGAVKWVAMGERFVFML